MSYTRMRAARRRGRSLDRPGKFVAHFNVGAALYAARGSHAMRPLQFVAHMRLSQDSCYNTAHYIRGPYQFNARCTYLCNNATAKWVNYSVKDAERILDEMCGDVERIIEHTSSQLDTTFPLSVSEPIFAGMQEFVGKMTK